MISLEQMFLWTRFAFGGDSCWTLKAGTNMHETNTPANDERYDAVTYPNWKVLGNTRLYMSWD